MYGLVNQAIQCMAVQAAGEECWQEIRNRAEVTDPVFLKLKNYPDEMTYNLVAAASEVLETPPEEILRAFGRHWILFTVDEGYGPLLEMTGESLEAFLENLNHMHMQVAATMSDLEPPKFDVENTEDGSYLVHYESQRAGLAPMVLGLLEGLVERFEEDFSVQHTERKAEGAHHDIFTLNPNWHD